MNAVLNTSTYQEKQIIDKTHNPVLVGVKFKADNGTLERGLLVATVTGSDEHEAYNPTAIDGTQNVKGVLCNTVDTAGEIKVATLLKHGTVVAENLHVNTSALSADDTAALEAMTVYPL